MEDLGDENVVPGVIIKSHSSGSLSSRKDLNKNEKRFNFYDVVGNMYVPSDSYTVTLPAGCYNPDYDEYRRQYYMYKKNMLEKELYNLPNPIHTRILEDLRHFWESEERYRAFGNVYKRNILIYSLPGNGKTSLIRLLTEELINTYNGIVMYIENPRQLRHYPIVMERLRIIEPNRKVVTVIEDFDIFFKNDDLTSHLLNVLDGNSDFDNVVTIATTNYPEKIGEQFTKRPSRFNLVIEYPKPNEETRRCYIIEKLKHLNIECFDEVTKKMVERFVGETKGLTFDYLKEFMQGIFVDELSEEEILERIKNSIENGGKYKISEDKTSIGFVSGDTNSESSSCTSQVRKRIGF